jgi:hypothetical protein
MPMTAAIKTMAMIRPTTTLPSVAIKTSNGKPSTSNTDIRSTLQTERARRRLENSSLIPSFSGLVCSIRGSHSFRHAFWHMILTKPVTWRFGWASPLSSPVLCFIWLAAACWAVAGWTFLAGNTHQWPCVSRLQRCFGSEGVTSL